LNLKRIRKLNNKEAADGPVIYWMSRDQRVNDNWALIYAQEFKRPVIVLFCLVPEFLGATIRQYAFMLKGLQEVEKGLLKNNIPFHLLIGYPEIEIPKFIEKNRAGILVTDFDPLRIKRNWKDKIAKRIKMPFYEVDAHNIVPCWLASDKKEFGAYTLRPKINRLLPEFLEEFPKLSRQKQRPVRINNKWETLISYLKIDFNVKEVDWLKPGEKEAHKTLKNFIDKRLNDYPELRNDPNLSATSDLSSYLHFGQISAQRVGLEIKKSSAAKKAKQVFLEELIVRKELSDNFCFYEPNYDSVSGFPDWAKQTLIAHKKDKRKYLYTKEPLENGQTHDDLWNAAQLEMVKTGKMHNYMRMYWAKKILEWTKSLEQALEMAIYLNDKYELDGRDPNGYTGIAWSIGGVHDRAWQERPVFGKIRYMSYNGCKSKFDVKKYIVVQSEK